MKKWMEGHKNMMIFIIKIPEFKENYVMLIYHLLQYDHEFQIKHLLVSLKNTKKQFKLFVIQNHFKCN